MKHYLFCILLIFLLDPLKSISQKTTLTGQIVDSTTNLPIELATITGKNPFTKTSSIAITNNKGYFYITIDTSSSYTLVIECIGYAKKTIQHISLYKKTNLGKISLRPFSADLKEIVVKSRTSPIGYKNDRQIFKANQFDNAKSGTAIDILKNLPSVAVNSEGEITLRGNNNFLVLINGKPSLIDAPTILSQLPANTIENIEIITTPSARYDPDGKAGIINITTKKGINDGWVINANAMGGLPTLHGYDNGRKPSRYSGDITIGYKKNKLDLTAGLNYLRNDAAGHREGNPYTIVNDTLTNFPSVGERSFKRYNYGLRSSAIYSINTQNTLTAAFSISYKHFDREADLNYNNSKENATTQAPISNSPYYNANNQKREGTFTLGNIDYTHAFSKNSNLTASFLFENADLSGATTNNNLVSKFSNDTIQYTQTVYKNPLNGYRAKLDYQYKTGNTTIETGYQYRYDTQDGSFDYFVKDQTTGSLVLDPNFSSQVKVANTIHAVYAQYSVQQTKKFYSMGLRFETAERKLWFSGVPQPNLTLNDFFPFVQTSFTLPKDYKLKIGISRRVKRTTNTELNPFPEREHSETLERGDAKLLPEYVNLGEAGIVETFRKGSWYATLYDQRTENIIQRLNSVYNDTILNRIYTNATKAEQYGLETGITLNPATWWQMLAGVNVFQSHISGTIFNGTVSVDNQKIAYTVNTTQSFKLPEQWSVQFSLSYLSLRPTAQGQDGAFVSPNLSIKKTINSRWGCQFQWLNMDMGLGISNIQSITTSGGGFYTTTNYIVEPDWLQIAISYSFNKLNKKISKLPTSEIGEKEF